MPRIRAAPCFPGGFFHDPGDLTVCGGRRSLTRWFDRGRERDAVGGGVADEVGGGAQRGGRGGGADLVPGQERADGGGGPSGGVGVGCGEPADDVPGQGQVLVDQGDEDLAGEVEAGVGVGSGGGAARGAAPGGPQRFFLGGAG